MLARNKGTRKKAAGRPRPWSQNRALWFGAAVVLVLLLAVWVPGQMRKGSLPQEGQPIADFTATDSDGQPFRLSDAYRDHDLILVFYRGYG